ncbi:hypothetical protein Q1695_015617 [Nippostrongylus brasiliensis]|nr:hypothetical protein Q1695_015617 [Nippostrongylus brasiliensis]
MARKIDLKLDVDEDEETWLTPQLSERTIGTQSKPVDLKEWFGQIQTSDRASLLSKKLQKYAQKRAARSDRMRLGTPSSLDVVSENDGSPEPVSPVVTKLQPTTNGSEAVAKTLAPVVTPKNNDQARREANDSGIGEKTAELSAELSTPASVHLPVRLQTSTPLVTSATGGVDLHSPPLSPVMSHASSKQMQYDSDDEFFDASSDFNENVQEMLLTSSLHDDQLNGNGMLPDDSGISAVRNCMTQSLMKVEEETPVSQLIVHSDGSKPLRSSSVSPRPVSAAVPVTRLANTNSPAPKGSADSVDESRIQSSTITPLSSRSRSSTAKQPTRLSRPATTLRPLATHRVNNEHSASPLAVTQKHVLPNVRVANPKAQLLQALISTPTPPNKAKDRNCNPASDGANNRTMSATRAAPTTQNDIPDLAALREIARQQEEALRQAVEQQQHGNIERKHSWQNDGLSKSVHSSVGSLVSSKSVDMSSLHKVNANHTSKIPGPTRVPRKSGIPAPTKRIGVAERCASAVPQSTDDDECF